MEMEKTFNPQAVESEIYRDWESSGAFEAHRVEGKKPFTIVMPPPNITGQLHMGHALDCTLQDLAVRYHRMKGDPTLWLPGTDHAAIATEVKIVDAMRKEGLTKESLGRKGFLDRAWKWKEEYGGRIVTQQRRMGISCDWSRERFTMDEGCSKAVREVFVRLYEKGLIYRGNRLVNWCPCCESAISDAEVEYQEKEGNFWHLLYPVKETGEMLELATTRPETMLGDTAVAINAADPRYAHLHGCHVLLPLANREIPIICDEHADMEKGTGVVKITPAHDPNDNEVGQRHNLPVVRVFTYDGHMTGAEDAAKDADGQAIDCGKYAGMTTLEARKAIVADLQELGLLKSIEPLTHEVGTCYRCHTVIEPMVSRQWFVKMKPLAEPAIACVKSGETKFVPERFTKQYMNWMENIRDWCISRQLWWGHRIPAYYLPKGGFVVAETPEQALDLAKEKTGDANLKMEDLRQEDDCLDTWFSSWLWPISLFDGINNPGNEEIKYYYPTADLVTGPDIIFFWVARMIMAGYEYMGDMPFRNVYFTGIVRDKIGRKMSKSLGNSPDPLELIEQFGADGVRMGMMLAAPAGNDILFDEALCEQGRNFNNKIWNAFRLVKGWQVADIEQPEYAKLATEWFDSMLAKTAEEVNALFGKYRLSEALMAVYKLFWDEFSSWYLEMVKPAYGQPIDKVTYEKTLAFFETLLKLLHPFMPFITEELWQHIYDRQPGESIMTQTLVKDMPYNEALIAQFEAVKEVISGIRTIRLQKNIAQKEALALEVTGENPVAGFGSVIAKLCNLSEIKQVETKSEGAAAFMVGTTEYAVPLGNLINVEEELKKLEADLKYQEGFLQSVMKKLSNEKFVSKAPANVIEMERKKQADAETKIAALKESIAALKR